VGFYAFAVQHELHEEEEEEEEEETELQRYKE
jgi:hypothetical protein